MNVFQRRRAKLWQALRDEPVDAVWVTSPVARRYFSGFTGSAGYLLLTPDQGWLVTDFRYLEQAGMEAPDLTVMRQQRAVLRQWADWLPGSPPYRVGFEADHVTVAQWRPLENPDFRWHPVDDALANVRMVKSADEIEAIRKACQIAGQALGRVMPAILPGISERDIARRLWQEMLTGGADGLAFDLIVASGERGALPHGHPTDRRLKAGDMVTIDFGAVWAGYHSDETVTWAIGSTGPDRERQRTIYDIVLMAQKQAIDAVRPGVSFDHIDQIARSVIEAHGYGAYFGHGVGHGVGLAVHEAPWVNRGRPTCLEPGMVITVEPGIYLPEWGGVRLEDTLAVTETGAERLTWFEKTWTEVG
ncbi:peptidase M24 [Sulfobacillus acidophilus TPY]|uniref:Peptidase M24 n=1 Tax=Sulfobacillus acidophilus (strain ATCC 700253 / DSM 10332 / NAL) TaxID=679936 RepID=G8TYD5_SULAD|nr:peptidase M24 [Sulfobacillus acidophilus TPY]AEW05099.1 peptidase M24 [Sulfobacillus acidophilus DSM 10332]